MKRVIEFKAWLAWKMTQKPKRQLTIVNEDTIDEEYQEWKEAII